MAEYVSVRSNWLSIDSISLERICDIDIEDRSQSTTVDKQDECHEQVDLRKTTSTTTDENITHIILRSDQDDKRDDPVIILSVIQSDEYHIKSIQLLSNARHIEFYHQEYIGSCQGSRITELEQDPIYESIFDFPESQNEVTFKCLKLADKTDLILYCLQISLIKSPLITSPASFPFDVNRVRSMIDENNLSKNARQFMNDLQHMQEQRRSKSDPAQDFNLGHIMTMMKGMQTSSTNTKHLSSASISSTLQSVLNEQVKSTSNQDHESIKQELNALENRLEKYIDKRFIELQQHIDQRFDRLEEKLTNSNR